MSAPVLNEHPPCRLQIIAESWFQAPSCSCHRQGQECERLICLGDSSCLLATTTSTLVLVSWPGGALRCRRLAPPAGLLGGIGRRVSSLIWGSMQAAGAEEVGQSARGTVPPAGVRIYPCLRHDKVVR